MTHQDKPALSVILVTPDCYETVRKTITHLRTQTVKHLLELVIVVPSVNLLNENHSELSEFCRFLIVESGSVTSIGSANAKGIRQATAPIVALAEDHAFPAPGWAEALIAAHRYPWAAVGPVMCNSNDPQNVIAWADFLIAFGEFLCPCESEVVERLPGNNSSYKRDLLLEYGPRLESMMETETLLQKDLQRKGYQLYLESGAQVFHLNFERMISFLSVKYLSGRVFGATRASDWSMFYRLYYVCGTPLIPLVCYLRLRKRWKQFRGDIRWPFRVLPLIWCGLLINATGEMIGCCFGAGQSVKKLAIFEFHRLPHLKKTWRTFKEK